MPDPRKPSLQGLRCRNCDTSFRRVVMYPIPIEELMDDVHSLQCPHCDANSKAITLGENLSLVEDKRRRQPGGSEAARAANWVLQGETGLSSLAIHAHMTGQKAETMPAPHDLDDLRRCVLLLHHLPEWQSRMGEMTIYPAWEKLGARFMDAFKAYLEDSPNLDSPSPAAGEILEQTVGVFS